MPGAPDILAPPKMSDPGQIVAQGLSPCERECGSVDGSTLLLPNIETARGLIATAAIAGASSRVMACLIGSEDLAADLGAERRVDGIELANARQRFLLECVAAWVVAVDCPRTRRDADGLAADTRWARRPVYKARL